MAKEQCTFYHSSKFRNSIVRCILRVIYQFDIAIRYAFAIQLHALVAIIIVKCLDQKRERIRRWVGIDRSPQRDTTRYSWTATVVAISRATRTQTSSWMKFKSAASSTYSLLYFCSSFQFDASMETRVTKLPTTTTTTYNVLLSNLENSLTPSVQAKWTFFNIYRNRGETLSSGMLPPQKYEYLDFSEFLFSFSLNSILRINDKIQYDIINSKLEILANSIYKIAFGYEFSENCCCWVRKFRGEIRGEDRLVLRRNGTMVGEEGWREWWKSGQTGVSGRYTLVAARACSRSNVALSSLFLSSLLDPLSIRSSKAKHGMPRVGEGLAHG